MKCRATAPPAWPCLGGTRRLSGACAIASFRKGRFRWSADFRSLAASESYKAPGWSSRPTKGPTFGLEEIAPALFGVQSATAGDLRDRKMAREDLALNSNICETYRPQLQIAQQMISGRGQTKVSTANSTQHSSNLRGPP